MIETAVERLQVKLSNVNVTQHTRLSKKGNVIQVDAYVRALRNETNSALADTFDRLTDLPEDRMKKQQIVNEFRRRGTKLSASRSDAWDGNSADNSNDEDWTSNYYESASEIDDDRSDDVDGLRSYQGSGFYGMNRHLRGVEEDEGQVGDVSRLDAAFDRLGIPVGKEMDVFRSADWSPEGAAPGMRLRDKGYLSTTFDRRVTEDFGDWQYKITVPAEAKYLPGVGGDGGEQELIFPRDSILEITFVDPHRRMVEAKLIIDGN